MSLFISRLKNWLGYENFTASDIDAEFNNIIQKVGADTLSSANSTNGSSPTVNAMQTTESPGDVGTEVVATTSQEDTRQERYQLNAIIGGAQWYSPPAASLSQLSSSFAQAFVLPASRIISGRLSNANQPMFLVPDGTAATVTLKATSTNFVAYFNSSQHTFSADIATTGLTLAPAVNNTCLVNDSTLAGAASTKTQGEYGSSISIGTIGANITALAGNFAAFKTSTEYFIAQIENGTAYATPTGSMGLSATATTTNTSAELTLVVPAVGIYVGMTITGTGIPGGTTVLSFAGNTLTMSANATASAAGVAITLLGTKLTSVSSTSAIEVGQTVSGTGVTAGTTVTAISQDTINGYTVTLSAIGTAVSSAATYTFAWYRLRNAFRGVGFDSADAWSARVALSNTNTITLMKLTWVFATYNASTAGVGLTYNKPTVAYAQPSGPAIGDYWYDLTNSTWKVYNGTSFASTIAVFVGVSIQDTTGCKAARSDDLFKIFSSLNTIEPVYLGTGDVQARNLSSKISVYGSQYYFQTTQPGWNTTNNLDTGTTLTTNTKYYCYITDLGDVKISIVAPSARKFDLLGAYHPAKPWRCVADFTTDGSSNIVDTSINVTDYNDSATIPNGSITGSKIAKATIDGSQLVSNSVTRSQLFAVGQQISGSSLIINSPAGFISATRQNVTITTSGRPVFVGLVSDGINSGGAWSVIGCQSGGAVGAYVAQFKIQRDGAAISLTAIAGYDTVGSLSVYSLSPPGSIFVVDVVPAGTYVYNFQFAIGIANSLAVMQNVKLIAFEL